MTLRVPVVQVAGVLTQLPSTDNVATLAKDAAWTAKGDTIAGTASGAAAITSVGDNGTNFISNSANTNGVGWSQFARNSNTPTVSETLYDNQTMVIPINLTLGTGITLTMGSNAVLTIL
jgi:hypothetical protein